MLIIKMSEMHLFFVCSSVISNLKSTTICMLHWPPMVPPFIAIGMVGSNGVGPKVPLVAIIGMVAAPRNALAWNPLRSQKSWGIVPIWSAGEYNWVNCCKTK
jgi:hypothetical protein